MHPDNPDLTAREREIKSLQLVIAKHQISIEQTSQALKRMHEKQIHRLAELRCQELMLRRAKRLELRAEVAATVARMTEE